MADESQRSKKGTFGQMGLPASSRYLRPPTRRALLFTGLLAGLVLLGLGLLDIRWGGGGLVSGGPLSSAHATLEADCASCHGGFQAVADTACSVCHEKWGDDVGTFTFGAHALYRSNDFGRPRTADGEPACATCHPEHQGRQAEIIDVPDSRCQACHERTRFEDGHPQFAFAETPEGDDDALTFAHGHHVKEIMKRTGWADLERACLACHQPTDDGNHFRSIDFDLHCDACHLTAGVATPRLATRGSGGASGDGQDEPGVWTLERIRASGLPGTDWSFYMDPGEFRRAGSLVAKTPLHHEDPWVLFNLRLLRKERYPDAGLADLLVATPDLEAADARDLYAEAVSTLEEQVVGLRGTSDPAAQAQLAAIEAKLDEVKEALQNPTQPLDETSLLLALTQPVEMSPERLESWNELVEGLSAPCLQCHRVERATIARVREDQRTMVRAEFDHGAHVIERRCLDCHDGLPILEALSTPDGAEGSGGSDTASSDLDRSAIFNLPRIETCRECHRAGLVASRCIDCHLYHPDSGRHGDLLLHLGS